MSNYTSIVSETTLLALVASIYDAAGNAELWPAFLEQLAEALNSSATGLMSHDLSSHSGPVSASVRIDPSCFDQPYPPDIWAVRGKNVLHSGVVETSQMLCPDQDLVRSDFYDAFLRPQRLFHQCGGVIHQTGTWLSVITSLREQRAGAFDKDATDLLAILLPHLTRAVELHRRITVLESDRDSRADVLNKLGLGIILVDARRRAIFLNRRAEAILSRNDGLRLQTDGLHAANFTESTNLRTMIIQCVQTGSGKGFSAGGAIAISRPSMRRSYAVVISPIRSEFPFPLPAYAERPCAAIFVTDPADQCETSAQVLARLFVLTPAESRVAFLIMQGKSVEQAADELAVTRETVRVHLKRLFSKTSTKRQGELIRLLLCTPGVLQAEYGAATSQILTATSFG